MVSGGVIAADGTHTTPAMGLLRRICRWRLRNGLTKQAMWRQGRSCTSGPWRRTRRPARCRRQNRATTSQVLSLFLPAHQIWHRVWPLRCAAHSKLRWPISHNVRQAVLTAVRGCPCRVQDSTFSWCRPAAQLGFGPALAGHAHSGPGARGSGPGSGSSTVEGLRRLQPWGPGPAKRSGRRAHGTGDHLGRSPLQLQTRQSAIQTARSRTVRMLAIVLRHAMAAGYPWQRRQVRTTTAEDASDGRDSRCPAVQQQLHSYAKASSGAAMREVYEIYPATSSSSSSSSSTWCRPTCQLAAQTVRRPSVLATLELRRLQHRRP